MTCAVCLSELSNGQVLTTTSCGHLLHELCLNKWLAVKRVCNTRNINTIKVFTTINAANNNEASTEAIETSQAFLEVQQENARIRRQMADMEASQQNQREQENIRELAREHYNLELIDNNKPMSPEQS